MNTIIEKVRAELKRNADEKTKNTGQNYFKEKIRSHGVRAAVVNRMSKDFFKTMEAPSKAAVFNLCEELWKSGYIEESIIACNWSWYVHRSYQPEDFVVFERWVNEYVDNWASCDTLCSHTIGGFLEMYPDHVVRLKDWARSDNRWTCRAAAVSLILPARHGKFLKEMLEIADILLLHQEDLVQKGYGWMLKVASQAYQHEVFEYVMKKKEVMPRTALRYAIEKMPPELRTRAMARN